jgi:hypothetical protein
VVYLLIYQTLFDEEVHPLHVVREKNTSAGAPVSICFARAPDAGEIVLDPDIRALREKAHPAP